MKREVCCPACAREWRNIMQPTYPELNHEGEGMRQVAGKARVECVCDGCSTELSVGADAVAVSVYSDSVPYFQWESECVQRERIPQELRAADPITEEHLRLLEEPE